RSRPPARSATPRSTKLRRDPVSKRSSAQLFRQIADALIIGNGLIQAFAGLHHFLAFFGPVPEIGPPRSAARSGLVSVSARVRQRYLRTASAWLRRGWYWRSSSSTFMAVNPILANR